MEVCEKDGGIIMIEFAIFMFAIAILFFVIGFLVYRGNTNLINCYHQEKVKDKATYCKAFGKALLVTAVAPTISGVIALFGETDAIALTALAVLIVGCVIGLVLIFHAQKKYGGGLF